MMDKLGVSELEGWRSLRATSVLSKEIDKRKKLRQAAMQAASVDGTIDTIRRISGALEELDWLEKLIATEGASSDVRG